MMSDETLNVLMRLNDLIDCWCDEINVKNNGANMASVERIEALGQLMMAEKVKRHLRELVMDDLKEIIEKLKRK